MRGFSLCFKLSIVRVIIKIYFLVVASGVDFLYHDVVSKTAEKVRLCPSK